MLYDAYEVQRSFLAGAGRAASMGAGWLQNPVNPWGYGAMGPIVAASLDVFAHAAAPRGKPDSLSFLLVADERRPKLCRSQVAPRSLWCPFGARATSRGANGLR